MSFASGRTCDADTEKIKFALDPFCLLNCDKVVRVEKGKEH